ncbi:hypothetical protein GBAR_LOCUS8159, partial [Geodia barretti]
TTESAANTTTAAGYGHEIRTELSSQPATGLKPYRTSKEVKDDIDVLECEFNSLKKRAIELLEASKLGVEHVVYELTTLSSSEIDQYKVFLEEKLEKLRQSKNNLQLFGDLNLHWTYLSPHFLKNLVNKLSPLNELESDMKAYMNDLHIFRERTPLDIFCTVDKKYIKQPEGFSDVVVKFKEVKLTKGKLTLQDIEDFRQQYADCYQLREFAIMLKDEVKQKSFVVTFFVPDSVIEVLSAKVPRELLLKFGVTKLDVAGTCLYSEGAGHAVHVQPPTSTDEHAHKKALAKHVPERSQFVRERISRFEKPAEPRATPSKKQWRNTSSGERISFLKGAAPRSPAINQTEQIETAQIPAPTSTHDVGPQTTESVATSIIPSSNTDVPKTAGRESHADTSDAGKSRIASSTREKLSEKPTVPNQSQFTSRDVLDKMKELEKKFLAVKSDTIKSLETHHISVESVTDSLGSLSPDDISEHKMFSVDQMDVLEKADNQSMLIGQLDYNMDYLSYHLLDSIVDTFGLKEVKPQMEEYKSELMQFRMKTPLALFCQKQERKRIRLSPGFEEVVSKFDYTTDMTLEDVEQFRLAYASHYKLQEFAMMISAVRPGSFIVTWHVPSCIVEKLKTNVPKGILKKWFVATLTVAGTCVYHFHQTENSHSEQPLTIDSAASITEGAETEDYLFVEQPSDDLFCPVLKCFLLHPHLTSCCGKHLSQKAVADIRGKGGACPVCKTQSWSTMLDKHFQRQVNSQRICCRHDDRGCGWQGELAAFHHHVKSCPMKDGPPHD